MELLWKAARKGNVPAMRILLDDMKGVPADKPRSVIDELAKRRQGAG